MKMSLRLFFIAFVLLFSSYSFCQNFEIYVSDVGDFADTTLYQILKYDQNGENPEVFISENLDWPQDIVFLEDQGIVLISSLNTGKITKHDIGTGDYLGDFATGIGGPTRMKIGTDDLLYVLQWGGNGKVKRYELDGTFVDDFTSMDVIQSIGIDWDNEGNLYVSTYGGNLVRKFDPDGEHIEIFANSNLQGPTNIWFDENADLMACNWNGTTVSRFDSLGNYIDNFITGLSNPEGVQYLPDGNILIGDGGTGAVKMFDADGNYIEDFIESGAGGLLFPNAVVLRELPVSTDQPVFESDFIRPTIGSAFFLNPESDQKIESIEIYNLSGKLIERNETTNHRVWNAKNYPEGLYNIVGKSNTGQTFTQKVIVQK